MQPVIGFVIGILFGCFLAWVGGFNFDERGFVALFVVLHIFITGMLGVIAGLALQWHKEL